MNPKRFRFRKSNGLTSPLYRLVIVCSIVLWMPVSGLASSANIKGTVVSVGPTVKIEYSGPYAPNIGDPVEMGFYLDEEFIPLEGAWKIVKVDHQFAWSNKISGNEDPAENYRAIIRTVNPKKRQPLSNSIEEHQNRSVLFMDTFDNDKNGWETSRNKDYDAFFESGTYVIETKTDNITLRIIDPGFKIPGKFSLEVGAIWKSGVKNAAFGSIIGANYNNYYAFVVNADGFAEGALNKDGKWMPSPIKYHKFLDRIPDGRKADHLRIVYRNNQITYYINNRKIGTFQDREIKSDWIIGLCVASKQRVAFDHLKITGLD